MIVYGTEVGLSWPLVVRMPRRTCRKADRMTASGMRPACLSAATNARHCQEVPMEGESHCNTCYSHELIVPRTLHLQDT
jgi:hypothetical protein